MSDEKLEELRNKKFESYMKMRSMPNDIIHLNTAQEFDNLVRKYPENVVVIDFWAEWCAPCKSFAPVFKRLQQEYSNEVIFSKVDVDENREIARRFGITGIPTTLFIKNGKVIHKKVGALNYHAMKTLLHKIKSKV
ncbi:MAG: thioredoxin [Promethearchaeota archaeon]|nr:MAG: thioredoxin [Candidatus Lokiarchaeota archaeon]